MRMHLILLKIAFNSWQLPLQGNPVRSNCAVQLSIRVVWCNKMLRRNYRTALLGAYPWIGVQNGPAPADGSTSHGICPGMGRMDGCRLSRRGRTKRDERRREEYARVCGIGDVRGGPECPPHTTSAYPWAGWRTRNEVPPFDQTSTSASCPLGTLCSAS